MKKDLNAFIERLLNDKLCGLNTMFLHTLLLNPEQLLGFLNGNFGERGYVPYQTATLKEVKENDIVVLCDYGSFVLEVHFTFVLKESGSQKYKIENISAEVL